ncbi:MAG: hypothetical protein NZ556_01405, partial [Fimbriimonadales bacterium]|nr:hypothetical protein [Fimbriimonadales bacterium]
DWRTDSGAFPDFVLASEATSAVGDGALLELKDSRTEAIASFNSTLPSARKLLSRLTAIVADAVRRYEACFRGEGTDERDCFYLVRTHKQDPQACRLSLVQGTFFETLPTPQLLAELWGQLFAQANVPEELQKQVIEYLSQLDRADIAQTRQVERASVKPRLRIMSEIHREGNPHTYPEVPPRSVNLILKLPEEIATFPNADERMRLAEQWALGQFRLDGVLISGTLLVVGTASLQMQLKEIQHRRNGLHLVVQVVV